jgi:predicted ATP-dependent endonuclease of OLD family
MRERHGDGSLDSLPKSDRLSSLKRQYETLLNSILTDHKSYISRIRLERESAATKMENLISRCARLETAVTEGTKELLKERGEKQSLQIRVEEMETNIELRILDLRNRLDISGRVPNNNLEVSRLKQENEQLRTNVDEFKVFHSSSKDSL